MKIENQGFQMQIKNNKGNYISLLPLTTKSQVLGWNIGEIYGPYNFLLKKEHWKFFEDINGYAQYFSLNGILDTDVAQCINILSGDTEQMKRQEQAFSRLLNTTGVESLNDNIKFFCINKPEEDITVQVWWTR